MGICARCGHLPPQSAEQRREWVERYIDQRMADVAYSAWQRAEAASEARALAERGPVDYAASLAHWVEPMSPKRVYWPGAVLALGIVALPTFGFSWLFVATAGVAPFWLRVPFAVAGIVGAATFARLAQNLWLGRPH